MSSGVTSTSRFRGGVGGDPGPICRIPVPGRVLRAVPAIVAELQEERAELGRLRQSHQRVLPALASLAEDSEQAS